jgi:hypothetical protein
MRAPPRTLQLAALFLCASVSCGAAPSLRALTLLETEDDDAQVAAVVELDAASGAQRQVGLNFSWSTEVGLSMDCVTAFAPAAGGAPARYLSVLGSGPSIATVDAEAGALTSTSPPLAPPYIVASMAWDAALGLLIAIAAPAAAAARVDLVSINASSGAVAVLAGSLALPFPQACQSALSLASGTFYTVSNDATNDEADQTVDAYALPSGRQLASAAWPGDLSGDVLLQGLLCSSTGTSSYWSGGLIDFDFFDAAVAGIVS